MNDIKIWTFTLLVCAMIAAIFENLTPSSQKKQLNYILQMFVLLCLIAPVSGYVNSKPEIDFSPPNQQLIAPIDTDAVLSAQFEARLTQLISNKLEMLGIFPREIGIDFSVSENAVEVSKVVIFLAPEDNQKLTEAQKALESFLGITVEAAVYEEVK